MERYSRLPQPVIPGLVTSLLSLFLAGCDNTPNPNFEADLRAKQKVSRGDPYATLLQRTSRYYQYLEAAPEMRPALAMEESARVRGGYIPLLKQLQGEQPIAALAALTQTCMPLLIRAGELDADITLNAGNVRATVEPLLAELTKCREAAIAAEEIDDKASAERANVFRRFASTAMVMVSISVTVRGDESGLELWQQNGDLAMKDRPGFKFKPRMLVGGY